MSGDSFLRDFEIVSETRRRWSDTEKAAIVAEASVPCTNVSAVARRHGIKPPLLFRWLKERTAGSAPTDTASFVPVTFAHCEASPTPNLPQNSKPPAAPWSPGTSAWTEMIEIELQNGRRVRVGCGVDPAALKQIIAVLEA
jgi:transposase